MAVVRAIGSRDRAPCPRSGTRLDGSLRVARRWRSRERAGVLHRPVGTLQHASRSRVRTKSWQARREGWRSHALGATPRVERNAERIEARGLCRASRPNSGSRCKASASEVRRVEDTGASQATHCASDATQTARHHEHRRGNDYRGYAKPGRERAGPRTLGRKAGLEMAKERLAADGRASRCRRRRRPHARRQVKTANHPKPSPRTRTDAGPLTNIDDGRRTAIAVVGALVAFGDLCHLS